MAVVVLACGHCGVPDYTARIPTDPGCRIVWEPNLCDRATEVLRASVHPEFDLVILTGSDINQQAVLLEDAVDAGAHPLRVRFLDAGRLCPDRQSIAAHVRGAVARVRASGPMETAPSRATNRFRGTLPRRALILPGARYRAFVPQIDAALCRADRGCDLCAQACPARAITNGMPPHIDPGSCTSCGLCFAACPVEAIGHPAVDASGRMAEAALLADVPHRNLLVVCSPVLAGLRAQDLELQPGRWRILEVPSLAALRPDEILRILSSGFDRIVGLSRGACCPDTPGPFSVVAAFLEGFGYPAVVADWDLENGPLPREWSLPPPNTVPSPEGFRFLAEAAAEFQTEADLVRLPGRGAGFVTVDADRCTSCGLCAERCWSQALAMQEPASDVLVLRFDHGRCDACGLCSNVCPEQALRVEALVDCRALGRDLVLKEDAWVLCRSCRTRVAPRAMVARVISRSKVSINVDLCPDCKPGQLFAGFPSKR